MSDPVEYTAPQSPDRELMGVLDVLVAMAVPGGHHLGAGTCGVLSQG